MIKVDVYNWDGKKVGDQELPEAVFDKPFRKDILHRVVRWQLAKRRQGTHKAKSRGEVSGGGKKPFKQKGTGNARQGTIRSPLMEGGAVTFGPRPRDYSYALPRKFKQLALKTALSHLAREGRFFVVEDMASAEGKTKDLAARIKKLGAQKAVLIDNEVKPMMSRASRNIKTLRYYSADGLNVYDLLKYDHAIVAKSSLEKVIQRCGVEA